jgi:hypothetical protein
MLAKSLGHSERVNVQKVLGRAKLKKSEESKNDTPKGNSSFGEKSSSRFNDLFVKPPVCDIALQRRRIWDILEVKLGA